VTTLKEQLRADLTTAIKARDELRSSTLRMALTAVTNEEVSGKESRELTDDDVLLVLGREAKKRREAATAYDDAGRVELAERERAELEVLDTYLPAQLTEAEVTAIIDAAVADAAAEGQTGMKAMGAVMKRVTPQVQGRTDGGAVAAAVRARLSAG
jgi:uncharacterized protein YqeY